MNCCGELRKSVDHELARQYGAGAGQVTAPRGDAKEREGSGKGGELDGAAGARVRECLGHGFPEDEQDGLRDDYGPDGAVEVAALDAFALCGAADAGE